MLILQPDAVVDIVDAIPEGNQVTVALRSGVMAVRSTNPRFALQTPGLTASVQDAFYTIEVQATGQTTLVAEQGAILGRTKEGVVALAQGEQMRVGPSQPASIGPARPPTLPTPPAPPTRTPTRVPTPVQTVVPAQRIHIVSEGDTLSYLAVKYGTTVEAIMQANHLDDPHTLSIGQRLIIP
jgi:LysM repeat protein